MRRSSHFPLPGDNEWSGYGFPDRRKAPYLVLTQPVKVDIKLKIQPFLPRYSGFWVPYGHSWDGYNHGVVAFYFHILKYSFRMSYSYIPDSVNRADQNRVERSDRNDKDHWELQVVEKRKSFGSKACWPYINLFDLSNWLCLCSILIKCKVQVPFCHNHVA